MPRLKRLRESQPRWTEIGQLRKGGPKTSEGHFGKELSYFRFTSDQPQLVTDFEEIYGKEPQELVVYPAYPTLEDTFPTYRAMYKQNGLMIMRCDGEMMDMWRDKRDGKMKYGSLPCPYCSGKKERTNKAPGCVPEGQLHVFLPELLELGYGGMITLRTKAQNDINALDGVLALIEPLQRGVPSGLMTVPLTLRRVEERISTPNPSDPSSRIMTKHWLVKMMPDAQWLKTKLTTPAEVTAMLDATLPPSEDYEPEAAETPAPKKEPTKAPDEPTTEEPEAGEPPEEWEWGALFGPLAEAGVSQADALSAFGVMSPMELTEKFTWEQVQVLQSIIVMGIGYTFSLSEQCAALSVESIGDFIADLQTAREFFEAFTGGKAEEPEEKEEEEEIPF